MKFGDLKDVEETSNDGARRGGGPDEGTQISKQKLGINFGGPNSESRDVLLSQRTGYEKEKEWIKGKNERTRPDDLTFIDYEHNCDESIGIIMPKKSEEKKERRTTDFGFQLGGKKFIEDYEEEQQDQKKRGKDRY